MKCPRCKGLLVRDRLLDLQDTAWHIDAWRCVSCGEVLDAVILANRRGRRAGQLRIA
jgi:hypothetical protein